MIQLFFSDPQNPVKMNETVPFVNFPTNVKDWEEESLNDFQWWMYAKDWEEFIKTNKQDYQADSEDFSKFNTAEFIKEAKEYYLKTLASSIVEKKSPGRILSFGNFSELSNLFEDESSQSGNEEELTKSGIKMLFAYNKLKAESKLDLTLEGNELPKGKDMAVFMSCDDFETGKEIPQTLKAYKVTCKVETNKSIKLVDISEAVPGGPIRDDATSRDLVETALEYGAIAIGTLTAGFAIWSTIKLVGGTFRAIRGFRGIQNLTVAGQNTVANPSVFSRMWKFTKNFLKTPKNLTVGFFRAFPAFFGALRSGSGIAAATEAAGAAFGLEGAAATAAGAGWIAAIVLGVTGIGLNIYSWFKEGQAPEYDDVKDIANGEFDPKVPKMGEPIVVCWSQTAGEGWLSKTWNLFVGNSMRTTMCMVKIADVDNQSIFLVLSLNSKTLDKKYAKDHFATFFAFDDSDVVERGGIDNEDLDFKVGYVDNIKEAILPFNFKGMCEWGEFMATYEKSSDSMFIADPDSPSNFNFNYEDPNSERINVKGVKLTDQELKSMGPEEMKSVFGFERISKYYEKNKPENSKVNESGRVLEKFSAFYSINEEDNSQESTDVSFDAGKPAKLEMEREDTGALPFPTNGAFSPELASSPAPVAAYKVEETYYANDEGEKEFLPEFTYFFVDPDDYNKADGDRVTVYPNTEEETEDARKGLYIEKDLEDEDLDSGKGSKTPRKDSDGEKPVTVTSPEEDEEDKIITTPSDVRIKTNKRQTVIRDKEAEGGINVMKEILTDSERELLGIESWNQISSARAVYERPRDEESKIVKVVFRNKDARMGDTRRVYTPNDGEAFDLAVKFVEDARSKIKYKSSLSED